MVGEDDSSRRKTVALKFIDDKDVGWMAVSLSKLKATKDPGSGKSEGRRLSQSALRKNKVVEDDGHEEIHKLLEEELPEECMENAAYKLSDELLNRNEESHFGFQTPKKRRGMTLKAQESANKYCGTPDRNATPSKLRSGELYKLLTSTTTPSQQAARSRRSRILFGGEMGATPSKGDVLNNTPRKSVLKNSTPLLEDTRSPSSKHNKVAHEKTPSIVLRRIASNEDLNNTPRKSVLKNSMSLLDDTRSPSSKHNKVAHQKTPSIVPRRIASNEDLILRTPNTRQSMASKLAPIDEDAAPVPKTPYNTRQRIKQAIDKEIKRRSIEDDSDSEASPEELSSDEEDEYKPKSDESSEEESGSDDKGSDETDEERTSSPVRKSALTSGAKKGQTAVTPSRPRRDEVNYEFATDAYFEMMSKDITSNNTLSRLRNPRLREDTVRDLLEDTDVDHKEEITKLTEDSRTLFSRWLFLLSEGSNILLYGLGSKRHLLQDFHDRELCDSQVLVVNGFFPGLTIKEILDTILTGLLGEKESPANPLEAVEVIANIQSSRHANMLYLLIHNLDGPSLRNNKAQTVLSKLAKIPNTRLIASIDHINAPLMWDQTKLCRYNFSWWNVTTMMPYSVETCFESSLLIQRSGALQLSSLHSVFKSLTANAKKVYLMIAKHQLENANNHSYTGLPFQELYWKARNDFVVSSQMALRGLLTEFLDHHMVKVKRGGEEALVIPTDNALVQQFIQAQEEKRD